MIVLYCLFWALYAAIFILMAGEIGFVLLSKLGASNESLAFRAVCGFCPLLIVLWYVQPGKLAQLMLLLWCAAGFGSLLFKAIRIRSQSSRSLRIDLYTVLITAIIVAAVYGTLAGTTSPIKLGNSDLYEWYSIASTFIGKGRYSAMGPVASEHFKGYLVDGFGTSWMLALVGFPYRDPINSAPQFIILALCWLALAIQWQIRVLFGVGLRTAIGASIIAVTTPFVLYLSLHSFYAQLLGTIGGSVLIGVFMDIISEKNESLLAKTAKILGPLVWILCVYESGFIVFQAVALGFAFCICLASGVSGGIRKFGRSLLAPYIGALGITWLLLPGVATYMVSRTVELPNAVVGWPLPLIPAYVFSFVPWFDADLSWTAMWGKAGGMWQGYAYLLIATCFSLVLIVRNEARLRFSQVTLAAVWFLTLLGMYLIWFKLGRASYQNWKFASFFLYSLSFIPLGIFLLALRGLYLYACSMRRVGPLLITLGVAVWALSTSTNIAALKSSTEPIGPLINELNVIRESVPSETAVVVDLASYGPSMLAMMMLSSKAEMFSIAQTYMPPVVAVPVRKSMMMLTSAGCLNSMLSAGTLSRSDLLTQTQNYALVKFSDYAGYRFGSDGGSCGWGKDITLGVGFSHPEPWGRWTDGGRAVIDVALPAVLRGIPLRFNIFVAPYIAPGVPQKISIYVNDNVVLSQTMAADGVLSFDLPASVSKSSKELKLSFQLHNPISPSEVQPGNRDQRQLAFGFVSLGIRPF